MTLKFMTLKLYDLKIYGGVMCHDSEEWYKNWRGTDSTQSRKCMTLNVWP